MKRFYKTIYVEVKDDADNLTQAKALATVDEILWRQKENSYIFDFDYDTDWEEDLPECPDCDGRGWVVVDASIANELTSCGACNGTGLDTMA